MKYDQQGRPLAASGREGPGSTRDRSVRLELVMGELGCGDLIYELKLQFGRVGGGELVRVVTNDPGAPRELPAWCRMTGHRLLESDAPFYVLQARDSEQGDRDV